MNFEGEIQLSGHQIIGRVDVTSKIKDHKKFTADSDNDNRCVSGEHTCVDVTSTCKDIDKEDCFLSGPNKNFNQNMKLSVGISECREEADDKFNNYDTKLNDKTDDASEYFTCGDENDRGIQTVSGNSCRNIEKILSPVLLIECGDLCNAKRYKNIMNTLEEFQAQSKWDEHKRLISVLHTSEMNLDLKIVLFLEEGMAQMMQKNISSGKKLFRKALQLSSQSENSCLLQGRSLMFLGNAYRKQGPVKYGKAFKCLTSALQNLSLVESKEDNAEINYFLGVFYLNMLNVSPNEPSQKSRDRVEKHYQAVYDYAIADSATRVQEKVQRIFPLGMANFLLDGQTELARSRMVPENKVKRAQDGLKHFIHHFPFDEQPITMQTDYCKAMSDLEYRKGNLYTSQVSHLVHWVSLLVELHIKYAEKFEIISKYSKPGHENLPGLIVS